MKLPFLISIIAVVSAVFLSSCVSKKKFLGEVDARMICDSTLQLLNTRNLDLNRQIARLELQLAEKTGERNAFREIIDKKENQIDKLEQELESVTNRSQNKQESLDKTLQRKDQQLADKQAIIDNFKNSLTTQNQQLEDIIARIRDSLDEESLKGIEFEVKKGIARISIEESLLFRKGTTRLQNSADLLIEKMAEVFIQYPAMDIEVVGHTDNEPVKSRSLNDNWDLSVLRATPLVRAFTKDYGLNPNQIMACGKGDSKPKSSNDTSEGKEQNRRTEIVIYPPTDRIIQKFIEAKN